MALFQKSVLQKYLKAVEEEQLQQGVETPWRKEGKKSDPDRIRTCDLLIRSQLLYPAELRDRVRRLFFISDEAKRKCGCKDIVFLKKSATSMTNF